MPTKEFMDWIKETNEVIKKANYRIIFLPDDDLMPYEHVSLDTEVSNRIMKIQDEYMDRVVGALKKNEDQKVTLTLSEEELDMVQIALMIYKTVLLEVHKDEVKKGLRRVIEALGKKQKEEE